MKLTPLTPHATYADEYQERFDKGLPQKQLSKEFVREWLMENGFQGKKEQTVPFMSDDFVNQVSERYIELYENITGEIFEKADITNVRERINRNCQKFLGSFKS